MNKEIIIFDFDGVVVDSLQLGYSIKKKMMPDLKYSEWTSWFEGNLYKNIRKEHANKKSQNEFHKQYAADIIKHSPIHGMPDTLKKLSTRYDLIIVSSSVSQGIRSFLVKHKIKFLFKEILGADVHQSKIEKFKIILNRYSIKPEETLIVTDSVGDIKEAKSVGIKSIAVTWGVHSRKKLAPSHPDFIATKPAEIIIGISRVLV